MYGGNDQSSIEETRKRTEDIKKILNDEGSVFTKTISFTKASTIYLMNTKLFRLFILFVFFSFFYQIIEKILYFFDVDELYGNTYLIWFSVIVIFWAFLPIRSSYLPKSSSTNSYMWFFKLFVWLFAIPTVILFSLF